MSSFLVLALAGSALAVPYVGQHGHHLNRQHNHFFPSGVRTGTGAPYAIANATGIYGATGTGVVGATGLPVVAAYAPDVSDAAAVAVSDAEAVSTSCSRSTVEVTETNRVTVTVVRSSSTEDSASAATTLYARNNFQGKQRSFRRKSTTVSTTVTTDVATSTSEPIATTTTTSVSDAPSSSAAAVSTTSSSAAASQSTSTGGKRGVAYNDASLTTPFEGASEVTWGYNWGQSSSGLSTSFNFVPMLWGTSSSFTNGWDASVKAAKAAGSTHLLAFNEPDLPSQSNMSPKDAAAAYKTYIQPYAGQFKLGAPAVTNGGGAMGLSWLSAFLTACDGCTIDFVPIHWYESATNIEYFKTQVANATAVAGGRPVWVTEFGCTSGSDSDISTFLEAVMPWMDSQSYVERYSYFMVANGLLVSGGATSSYGSTYKTYTS